MGSRVSKLHMVWLSMLSRCNDPNAQLYKDYGGRGITVCQAWAAATGYKEGLYLDRKDNDLGYTPGNCRWVTPKESANNRRTSRLVEAFGETQTLTQWAEDARCLVDVEVLTHRLNRGWQPEKAISQKPRSYHRL